MSSSCYLLPSRRCAAVCPISAFDSVFSQDLKFKTRIHVPEAALLIGVVDELGVLEYGQVFIQIDSSVALDAPQAIVGDVIVAKNPCFHPGDIRVLKVSQSSSHIKIAPPAACHMTSSQSHTSYLALLVEKDQLCLYKRT